MRIIMTAAAAVIALSTSAYGQQAAPKPGSEEQVITPQTVDRADLAQLVGNPVYDSTGEQTLLGKVANIILDEEGAPAFLIVESDEKLVAFPWGLVDAEKGDDMIIVDTTAAEMGQMPAYQYSEADDTVTKPLVSDL
jgi:hypothetical protein